MERTMNGYMGKVFALATAIALAFALMLTLGAGQAQAYCGYHKHLATAKGTIAISCGNNGDISEIELYSNANAKPAAVKLSKKGVVYLSVSKGSIYMEPKKPGTTTLTYRWNHKKHTVKIKVYKYQNPFASLTIGGKQYKSKFSKRAYAYIGSLSGKKTAPTGTLKVKNGRLVIGA